MNVPFNWTCPKCGAHNASTHDTDRVYCAQIIYCEPEDGGCGDMYVIESKRVIVVDALYSVTKVEAQQEAQS